MPLFGPEITELLRAALSPSFDLFFILVTYLGEDFAYIGLIAIVYWALDKRHGALLGYVVLLSALLNFVVKMSLRLDRPPLELRLIDRDDVTYGFPSGHAQNPTVFWSWAAFLSRRRLLWAVGIVLVVLVSTSRVYLGVHYLDDVLGGAAIGGVYAFGMMGLYRPVSARLAAIPSSLGYGLGAAAAVLFVALASILFPETSRDNAGLVAGSLFGLSVGLLFEERYVQLRPDVGVTAKAVRIALGISIVIGALLALSPLLPSAVVHLRFARYALVTFVGVFVVPLLFKAIRR